MTLPDHPALQSKTIIIGRRQRDARWIRAHVRPDGSGSGRIHAVDLSKGAAMKLLRSEDRARGRYLKKYFDKNIEDPMLYHLLVNTDLVSHSEAARLIAEPVLSTSGPVEV